jgi:hypothetical protein
MNLRRWPSRLFRALVWMAKSLAIFFLPALNRRIVDRNCRFW